MTDSVSVASALAAALQAHRARLVALLAARSRDIAAAEDAVAEAAARALVAWPKRGIPSNPAAWLLTVARNHWRDECRHAQVHDVFAADWQHRHAGVPADVSDPREADFPDERLKLLFVCTHPAIEGGVHTPLMLQVVLGVPVERMAGLFLVSTAALGQRLARAKTKLRDAGVAFEVPREAELPMRLPPVLDALYAAYGLDWEDATGPMPDTVPLARMLADRLPQPETLGLLALLLFCESRRGARRDAAGAFVPLEEQDVRQWDHSLMNEAADLLARASRAGELGRYQLEAAAQSIHARRADSGRTDWQTLTLLYCGMLSRWPSLGLQLGHIGALARWQGAEAAWPLLAALDSALVADHQPYWALRAELLERRGAVGAAEAYGRAAALCRDEATRNFLLRRRVR